MTKQKLLIELIELVVAMQQTGVDLISSRKYDSIEELMTDIFDNLGKEIETTTNKESVSGMVDRERTMFDIGDGQGLMIFGNNEVENGDE